MEEKKFLAVNFIFDNQNKIGEKAKDWYDIFKSKCTPEVLAHLGKPPDFGDEKKDIPLQAADMFAWYQRRSVVGSLGHESHVKVWDRLRRFQYSTILDNEHLVRIAADLGITGV